MTVDDVLEQLSPEAAARFDEQGYELLAKFGYSVTDAGRDPSVMQKIKRRMRRRKESLVYHGALMDEGFILWFELRGRGRLIGRTRGLYVKLGRGLGDGGGSYGEEDRADQAGTTCAP